MYINSDKRTAGIRGQSYVTKVYINSYHVSLTHEDGRVFERGHTSKSDEWLDSKHRRITKAIDALEAAILAAFEEE